MKVKIKIFKSEGKFGNKFFIYNKCLELLNSVNNSKIIIVCKKNDSYKDFIKIVKNFDNRIKVINSNFIFQALNLLFKLKSLITNNYKEEDSFLDIFYKGYYQSKKYQKKIDLNYLILNENDSEYFNKDHKNICSVHIRGGDYLSNKSIYCNLSKNYYINSIKKIYSYNSNVKFIFFSDDWQYAGSLIKVLIDKSIIKEPVLFKNSNYLTDFLIMFKSNFLICSNSTFSIQAAINGYSKHVIVPNDWFRNYERNLQFTRQLYPSFWIQIPDKLL